MSLLPNLQVSKCLYLRHSQLDSLDLLVSLVSLDSLDLLVSLDLLISSRIVAQKSQFLCFGVSRSCKKRRSK